MKTENILKTIALGLAVVCLTASQTLATIAYDTPFTTLGNQGAGHTFNNGPFTLGMEFTANQNVSVSSLGAFNSGLGGWASAITVAIYNVASQTIVGSSVTFSGTSGASEGTLAPGSAYRFQSVSPITLLAGQTYMIVASGLGTGPNPDYNSAGNPSAITTDTGGGLLTFLNANYYNSGSTLAFPTSLDGGPIGRYGAGSFQFSAVPEVQTFAIAGVGLLGLVFVGRKLDLRRKI